MAIVVPIVSEWNPKGVNKATADIQKAQGGWAKASAGVKAAALPAAAALGGIAVAGFAAFKAAEDAATANKKLDQVYSQIGYPELASQAKAYADTLSQQIGVEDEVIKSAQTKLATFSEVAKSADIMGQATGLAADLTAAGFGSMDTTATMLGKALQDPVKGMTALGKAGVTFTDQQKDQIKTLTKSGKAAEAQAIILGEVKKQVGGVAKASAKTTDKMAVGWAELQEQFGNALLPVIEKILPVFEKITGWISRNSGLFTGLVAAIAGIAAAILLVNGAMAVASTVSAVYGAVMAVVEANSKRAAAGQWALNAALLANPIVLIVVAIAALVAALVIAYKKSETFRNIVDGAMKKVAAVFGWLRDRVVAALDWIRNNWDTIVAVFKNSPIGLYIRAVKAAFDWLREKLGPFWKWIKEKWDGFIGLVENVIGWLRDNKQRLIDFIKSPFISAFNLIAKAWNATVGGITFKIPEWFKFLNPAAALIAGREFTIPNAPELSTKNPSGFDRSPAAIDRRTTNNYYISGAVDPQGTGRTIAGIQSGRVRATGRMMPARAL